jgi:CBS domain-containing protein
MVRVQDVMSQDVETVRPQTPAESAWERMRMRGVHHLVVTDGTSIVGLLSERDAGGRRGISVRKGRTVGELMTGKPVSVRPETPVRRAANLMRGRSIGSLVVTDVRARLLGIVTVADLLELLGRGIEHAVDTTARTPLRHRAPHRKLRRVSGVW